MNETLIVPAGSETDPPVEAVPGHGVRQRLPYSFAKRHGVQLNGLRADGRARVAHRPGLTAEALIEVRRVLSGPFVLEPMSAESFDALLAANYERGSSQAMEMVGSMEEDDLSSVAEQLAEPEDLLEAEDDAPIIRLINALLTEAIKENASDIHIENYENRMVVRFRVDGVLREVLSPPRQVAPLIVSRVKVMARLDIAEKRLPQDGRISLRVAGRPVDVRVSTTPTGFGERVVLRLLDKQAGRLELAQLGMPQPLLQIVDGLIHKPNGIVLVTGPTGSGKTTTLYAALSRLNDVTRNILTVEDPIEYYIEGIGQTQVSAKVEMTFARGLRAILRQDPDVVMVGEIRDLETAEIAVQASLTGHLVFSTLHTNSAIGAITRLRDLGVEPFLLSSSLIGVISQRLVRNLDPACREPHQATASECNELGVDPLEPPTIYLPRNDGDCATRAYKGRAGIYEVVAIDARLRDMIHNNDSELEMERYARTLTPSLRADGARKVLKGETSLEEVLRVTRMDD